MLFDVTPSRSYCKAEKARDGNLEMVLMVVGKRNVTVGCVRNCRPRDKGVGNGNYQPW